MGYQHDLMAFNTVLAYNPDRNEYLPVFTYYVQMGPTGDHDPLILLDQ